MTNNKLIAEFMGAFFDDNGMTRICGRFGLERVSDLNLKYHSSWDWLMPVVEKIEMLGYKFEKIYQPIDKDWQCLIVNYKGNMEILHNEYDESSLKASNYVVVEFIKRTNLNQQ